MKDRQLEGKPYAAAKSSFPRLLSFLLLLLLLLLPMSLLTLLLLLLLLCRCHLDILCGFQWAGARGATLLSARASRNCQRDRMQYRSQHQLTELRAAAAAARHASALAAPCKQDSNSVPGELTCRRLPGGHEGEEHAVELLNLPQVRLLVGLVLQALHARIGSRKREE